MQSNSLLGSNSNHVACDVLAISVYKRIRVNINWPQETAIDRVNLLERLWPFAVPCSYGKARYKLDVFPFFSEEVDVRSNADSDYRAASWAQLSPNSRPTQLQVAPQIRLESGGTFRCIRGHRHIAVYSPEPCTIIDDICSAVRRFCALETVADGGAVIHGSALEVGGGALLFIGASGSGKTTMSLVGADNGARYISNDRVVINWQNTQATACGWPDDIRIFKNVFKTKTRVTLYERFLGLNSCVEAGAIPIRRIVLPKVLPKGSATVLGPIGEEEAALRFGECMIHTNGSPEGFWKAVASSVSAWKLHFPFEAASGAYSTLIESL